MKTYKEIIEGKELVVTDSLVVAKFFELRHDHLIRTIRKIIVLEDSRVNAPTSGGVNLSDSSITNLTSEESGIFIMSTYKDKKGETRQKFIVTEDGFYILMMNIKGGSKVGTEKLHKIRMDFILEFKRLRDQNSKLANLGRIFIEYFAPIDEIGMLSIFNGKRYVGGLR